MQFFQQKIISFLTTFQIVLIAGLIGLFNSVHAADALTPANEGVCDVLHGGTPGLYGLCVAYCEAQDLDVINKEPPNTKILDNYRKKMKAGDPDMPCVHATCPCWTAEQAASIYGDGVAAACLRNTYTTGDNVQLIDDGASHYAYADTSRNRCAYKDSDAVPVIAKGFRVTPEEAQACYTPISQACTDLGL